MKHLFILILLFSFYLVQSQNADKETFTSSGELITNANNQLNFTVGEPIIGTVSNAFNNSEQGFWNAAKVISLSENDFLSTSIDINIFPNPVQDYLTVKFNSFVNQDYKILIFNTNGKNLFATTLLNNETKKRINLNNFTSGIYFLNVIQTNSNKTIVYKLIKQ